MLVKSAVVDCQKSALTILMCVRYVIHDYSAMYLSLLPLLTLLLLLPLSQPQIHVCMHFSVIRPAPARENRSDLNRRGLAIKWCVDYPVDTSDTSFEAFFQRSGQEIASTIEDHRQQLGCVYK